MRIAITKAELDKKETIGTEKLDLNLGKKSVKCYISSIDLYGDENCTLRKIYQKYLKEFLNAVLERDGEHHLDRSCHE
jgi:hypothetical protein